MPRLLSRGLGWSQSLRVAVPTALACCAAVPARCGVLPATSPAMPPERFGNAPECIPLPATRSPRGSGHGSPCVSPVPRGLPRTLRGTGSSGVSRVFSLLAGTRWPERQRWSRARERERRRVSWKESWRGDYRGGVWGGSYDVDEEVSDGVV